MNLRCGCCEGAEIVTPIDTTNRWPGEWADGCSRLIYRVGTHATFLETMLARLSSAEFRELGALRTHDIGDPSIALLDAWAVVGDVLTFYQERIANEGYLRTATERRSVLELARLVGYKLRPGVAASVYLAYTMEKDTPTVTIPRGTRAGSVPGPGEQSETFETADPLAARASWNDLKPRLTEPQTKNSIEQRGLFVAGTTTGLKVNDPLILDLQLRRIKEVTADDQNKRTRIVLHKAPAAQAPANEGQVFVKALSCKPATITGILERLTLPPSRPPPSAQHLVRDAATALGKQADARPRLLAAIQPRLQGVFYAALRNIPPKRSVTLEAHAMRVSAAPFGHNAPLRLLSVVRGVPNLDEWRVDDPWNQDPRPSSSPPPPPVPGVAEGSPPPDAPSAPATGIEGAAGAPAPPAPPPAASAPAAAPSAPGLIAAVPASPEAAIALPSPGAAVPMDFQMPNVLYMDNDYDMRQGTLIAIEKASGETIIVQDGVGTTVSHRSLAAYGLSGKTVKVTLPKGSEWLGANDSSFGPVRTTRVFAGSEPLTLVEVPITEYLEGAEIELSDLYEELDPGRWLIVSGERRDIVDDRGQLVKGVRATELVMLAAVEQRTRQVDADDQQLTTTSQQAPKKTKRDVPGDSLHTFIKLAQPLAYKYDRNTVKIYGNVVKATHGETRKETLGSGKAATSFQRFTLQQSPLTYVSAPTVSGVESTLEVRVNEVKWCEVESLAALGPNDRSFVTQADDDAKTTVIFGDGKHGARLPTGVENVKAVSRKGIGKGGNVRAGQISLPNDMLLGVKEVINPIRASGGADKEGINDARKNAPLPLHALDRLVSLQDYESFARTFAGIGKAASARMSDGSTQLVHVTVAGADDIPIEATSDLFRNLLLSLRRFGDPHVPIRLAVRTRLILVVSAKVRVAASFAWEFVEPKIRTALLARFGFSNVELGQDLLLADAIATIQGVPGVDYVDVDVFDRISESQLVGGFDPEQEAELDLKPRDRVSVRGATRTATGIAAAELAYLSNDVPETLILQELKT